jgi:hypothetical protein
MAPSTTSPAITMSRQGSSTWYATRSRDPERLMDDARTAFAPTDRANSLGPPSISATGGTTRTPVNRLRALVKESREMARPRRPPRPRGHRRCWRASRDESPETKDGAASPRKHHATPRFLDGPWGVDDGRMFGHRHIGDSQLTREILGRPMPRGGLARDRLEHHSLDRLRDLGPALAGRKGFSMNRVVRGSGGMLSAVRHPFLSAPRTARPQPIEVASARPLLAGGAPRAPCKERFRVSSRVLLIRDSQLASASPKSKHEGLAHHLPIMTLRLRNVAVHHSTLRAREPGSRPRP